jgi:hypothetical protein
MTFQAGPRAGQLPPTQEVPPSRGPGRPRKDGSAPRRSARSLETEIGSLLVITNLFVMSFPPTRMDALDMYEISALAKGIDQQCKQSPRFRRYVEGLLGMGSGGALLGVVLMIGARRASRHGFLPPEVDAGLGSMIQTSVTHVPTEAPASDRNGRGTA